MTKETQPHQFSGLKKSVEFIFQQNNKLNTSSLELHRQQDSMQIEMKKTQQALARWPNKKNYKSSVLHVVKTGTSHFFTMQKLHPAQEARA
jgi:hypothetical protein